MCQWMRAALRTWSNWSSHPVDAQKLRTINFLFEIKDTGGGGHIEIGA